VIDPREKSTCFRDVSRGAGLGIRHQYQNVGICIVARTWPAPCAPQPGRFRVVARTIDLAPFLCRRFKSPLGAMRAKPLEDSMRSILD